MQKSKINRSNQLKQLPQDFHPEADTIRLCTTSMKTGRESFSLAAKNLMPTWFQ